MGTRSMIGLKEYDGTVTAIYCHYDGYLEHNGKVLNEYWNDIEAVEELIDLGDISVLGQEIGVKHSFNDYNPASNMCANMCLAYGRDRGEKGVEATTYTNEDEMVDARTDCQYFYIFDGNEWTYRTRETQWKPLSETVNGL